MAGDVLPVSMFLPKASNFFVTIMTGQQKDNTFVLTPLHSGPRGGRRGPILARKSAFLAPLAVLLE